MAIGDVEFTGAQGAHYVLNFGCNAVCRLEANTGQTYRKVMEQIASPDCPMAVLRQFVHAVIVEPENPTIEQAGDILDDMGGADALALAFADKPST